MLSCRCAACTPLRRKLTNPTRPATRLSSASRARTAGPDTNAIRKIPKRAREAPATLEIIRFSWEQVDVFDADAEGAPGSTRDVADCGAKREDTRPSGAGTPRRGGNWGAQEDNWGDRDTAQD